MQGNAGQNVKNIQKKRQCRTKIEKQDNTGHAGHCGHYDIRENHVDVERAVHRLIVIQAADEMADNGLS